LSEARTREELFAEVEPQIRNQILRRYRYRGDEAQDIAQEACIRVWLNLEFFDQTNENAVLLKWAQKAARDAAWEYLRSTRKLGNNYMVPYDERIAAQRVNAVTAILEATGLPMEDMLEKLNLSYEEHFRIMNYGIFDFVSLDQKVPNEEGEPTLLGELIPDQKNDKPVMLEIVQKAISKLKTEQQMVVILHDIYGLDFEEIAYIDANNRARSTISGYRKAAFQELRVHLLELAKEYGNTETSSIESAINVIIGE